MAFAALATGGTFSARGGGSGVAAARLAWPGTIGAMAAEGVVAGVMSAPEATMAADAPEPPYEASAAEKSCRRTGSWPDWCLEGTAGVLT